METGGDRCRQSAYGGSRQRIISQIGRRLLKILSVELTIKPPVFYMKPFSRFADSNSVVLEFWVKRIEI